MRLNAPRVKVRGIRGRFVRECEYATAMVLADEVEKYLSRGSSGNGGILLALEALKRYTVNDYPSVIARKIEGEIYETTQTPIAA